MQTLSESHLARKLLSKGCGHRWISGALLCGIIFLALMSETSSAQNADLRKNTPEALDAFRQSVSPLIHAAADEDLEAISLW